jgi:hypothetical protein
VRRSFSFETGENMSVFHFVSNGKKCVIRFFRMKRKSIATSCKEMHWKRPKVFLVLSLFHPPLSSTFHKQAVTDIREKKD